jgi:hypothetical protein
MPTFLNFTVERTKWSEEHVRLKRPALGCPHPNRRASIAWAKVKSITSLEVLLHDNLGMLRRPIRLNHR